MGFFRSSLFIYPNMWDNKPMIKKEMKIRVHKLRHKQLKILAATREVSVNYLVDMSIAMLLTHMDNPVFKKFIEEFDTKTHETR
jgi:hypothetical protein